VPRLTKQPQQNVPCRRVEVDVDSHRPSQTRSRDIESLDLKNLQRHGAVQCPYRRTLIRSPHPQHVRSPEHFDFDVRAPRAEGIELRS
jgi:hypothetical protein